MPEDAIFGRAKEVASVAAFLDDDRSRMRVLLIEGEAGIGKTTLWEEGVRLARGEGPVLTSRPSQAEIRLSFSVLGDLLASVLPRAIEGLPTGQRAALEAALLLGPSSLGPSAPSRPDGRAVSLAVLGAVRSLASVSPVTVAIDDVQWTDPLSARALAFAFRRLADEPILVVAARRVPSGVPDPLDIAGLPSGVERLTLGPIAPVYLGRLLRKRLGRQFAPPLVQRIHHASGGNPFFAIEIGRALGDDVNPTPGEPLPVPHELDALLRDRLSSLSVSASQALLMASCSAMPTSALVAAAGGEISGLDEAEEAGIVVVRGGTIDFTHPLLAASVYGCATSRARQDVHARLADAVNDLEERARHLALSTDEPNEDAAAASEEAAHQAEARGAPSVAAELCQLAATLTPPRMVESLRRRSNEAVGNLWAAGDVVSARDLNERMLEDLEPGPGRAHTLYLIAETSWNDVPRVTSLLTRALDEVGDDRHTRAWILTDLAWAALWACDSKIAMSWADAALEIANALEIAGALDEPALLRSALSAKAMASGVLGHEANDLLERGISVEGRRDYNELATPRTSLGQLHIWRGALDSARETLDVELDQRLEQGHETSTWEVRALIAEVEYRAGRWGLAAEHAREAHEILVEAGWADVLGQVLPVKAAIACAMGDTQQARADGTEALAVCERMSDRWDEIQARSTLGFLELSLGDHAACHAWLNPLVELTGSMGLREPGAFPFVPDEVEALVVLGELEAAERLTDRLEQQGQTLNRALALATAARCRGLTAGARGDLSAAVEHLQRALLLHGSVLQPFELGRTLLVSGVVHRRMRKKKSARELLREALDIFVELAATLWAAKARSELARIGGRAGTPRELTGSEHRVAELAAAGSTNQEIADRLFISVKTVEANLSRAYHKLGLRSRRELRSALDTLERPDAQT